MKSRTWQMLLASNHHDRETDWRRTRIRLSPVYPLTGDLRDRVVELARWHGDANWIYLVDHAADESHIHMFGA